MVQEEIAGGPVIVAINFDSGNQGNPALRGRTAALAQAIAIVFGCPTYIGSGSAAFKAFMEETFYIRWRDLLWRDKLAAGFTNSAGMSGDKLLTLEQLAVFAAQHGMIWVPPGEFPGWTSSRGSAGDVNRLASFLGLMSQSNSGPGT
jgi:NAD(P)H dehydrogenase (quinone)